MTGAWRGFLRLFALQGAWSYERMQGIGMGYAAEPLLEDLREADPGRHADAVVRSAEFFNCHPYLAGLALGAAVRAEYDHLPGTQVARLRTALCGPLGSLGDQLFWSGVLPALMGAALALTALGGGLWGLAGFVVLYNGIRIATSRWALRTGLAAGAEVGHVIAASWLPRAARLLGPVAGFAAGAAIPIVTGWLLGLGGVPRPLAVLAIGVAGAALTLRFGAVVSSVRLALALLALTVVWRWTA